MSETAPAGIHHVTMIASDPQRCVDFYAGLLGLRLVKKTVNFDDPGTYHLYFGDRLGRPGTILTFFPYRGARRGRRGVGQADTVSLAIPPASVGYWLDRLAARNIACEPGERFGHRVLSVADPDGLPLELVADEQQGGGPVDAWDKADVPAEHQVRGVAGVTLWVKEAEGTEAVLTGHLGYTRAAAEGGDDSEMIRYTAGGEATVPGVGRHIDLRVVGGFWDGEVGAGGVHHVAFRVGGDEREMQIADDLTRDGHRPTPQIDRQYFHSVYFREPGGVLFELATDAPGFTADEPAETLGEALRLPPRYADRLDRLEARLPAIHVPGVTPADATPVDATPAGPTRGELAGYRYVYQPAAGDDRRVMLMLHGTGGDEGDMLPLADRLAPHAAVLSPRGNVSEGGMPRFFRRLSEGVFDVDDVRRRAGELAAFINAAADTHGFDAADVTAVGYSNGANIASAVVLLHPAAVRAAVLLRPVMPLPDAEVAAAAAGLDGHRVLMLAGRADAIAPAPQARGLHAHLRAGGAAAELVELDADHRLTGEDLDAAARWLNADT